MFRRSLVATVLSLALASGQGCNKPRPPQSAPGPLEAEQQATKAGGVAAGTEAEKGTGAAGAQAGDNDGRASAGATVDVRGAAPSASDTGDEEWVESSDSRSEPVPPDEFQDNLKKMKFALRREVVWARSAVANIPSYEDALARFDREFEEWNMYARVPKSPDAEPLRQELQTIVKQAGGAVSFLDIREEALSQREIPEQIRGDRAFEFEENDIRGILLATMSCSPADATLLKATVDGLKASGRLLHVLKATLQPEGATISVRAYFFREERYPIHIIEPKNLEAEMRSYRVGDSVEEAVKKDPIGYLQNAGMSVREFNASLPDVNRAMRLLSESKFKEARSAFFRRASEAAQQASPIP